MAENKTPETETLPALVTPPALLLRGSEPDAAGLCADGYCVLPHASGATTRD
jgi:hypothetical protein